MKESGLESILAKYPDLIEDGLILVGRQITVYGRRMDLLFEDRFKGKLIVELKAGTITDKDMGQVLSYEGRLLSADNPNIRVMLIGTRVPPNIQRYLDHHGIAWKEIKSTYLKDFLAKKGDNQFNNLFEDEISPSAKITKNEIKNSASIDSTGGSIIEGNTQQVSSRFRTPTEQELINTLRADLQQVYLEMRKRAKAFGPDVETHATTKNLIFDAGYRRSFAEIQRRKACLRIIVRPEGFNIPENTSAQVYGITVTRVPDTHLWTLNHQFQVDGNSPMDGVEKLLRQSYNAVKQ
jgi:hypothetical protein